MGRKVSPDGRRIAFQSDRNGTLDIYVMNADGSNIERLTYSGTDNYAPAWSPDGRMIAFASVRDGKLYDSDIYMVRCQERSGAP